jgi:hypothetical protein
MLLWVAAEVVFILLILIRARAGMDIISTSFDCLTLIFCVARSFESVIIS